MGQEHSAVLKLFAIVLGFTFNTFGLQVVSAVSIVIMIAYDQRHVVLTIQGDLSFLCFLLARDPIW